MGTELDRSERKSRLAIASLVVVAGYLVIVTLRFVAACYSGSPEESSLIRAARLDPGNAAYAHDAGRFELLAGPNLQAALPWLEKRLS